MPIVLLILCVLMLTSCITKDAVRPDVRTQKVALVLGAGASKGFSHIGVIKVLEANDIPIDMVIGTSAGSFVGSLYAYGYSGFDLQRIAMSISKSDIVDIALPDNGFIRGEKIEEFINRHVKNTPIDRLKRPFYAVSTDLMTGSETVFGKGNTGMAVRASCSIPGIFRPVKIGNTLYVDGAVVSPVAVNAARNHGASIVIAVDISGDTSPTLPEGTIETIMKSMDIMYARIASSQVSKADVVIRPRVSNIGSTDFSLRHEAILEGEKAAQEALPMIKSLIVTPKKY